MSWRRSSRPESLSLVRGACPRKLNTLLVERARIAERVKVGLARAKAQGKRLGRPRKAASTIAVPGGSVREVACA